MKKILIALVVVLAIISLTACNLEIQETPEKPEEGLSAEAKENLEAYLGGFGHVRVLGDIDHVLKGEKVDDEEGVVTQSMAAGTIAFNADKTELAIPLTLTAYDFDGHRNPEDPEPEKYTRIATGTLTLTLTGKMNAEGTEFIATGYKTTGVDLTLDVDDETYVLLDLPEMEISAETLAGIFTTADGAKRASLIVVVAEGKPVAIADLNTPKFGHLSGAVTVDGVADEI